MNREFLKSLGLEDEAIEKVMAEHGKTLNKTKEELEQATVQLDELKEQNGTFAKQLETLEKQAGGNKELEDQLKEFKEQNEKLKEEYEAKISKYRFDSELEKALLKTDARSDNARKAIRNMLNIEDMKLTEDGLIGFKEQIESIKSTDDYLFGEPEQSGGKPTFLGGNHQSSGNDSTENMTLAEAMQFDMGKQ